MWGVSAFLGCLSVRADQSGCLWKLAAHEDQDAALVLDLLCLCSRFSQESTSEGLCRIICVCSVRPCVCRSGRVGWRLSSWTVPCLYKRCVVRSRGEATENQMQPIKQAAQCQLLLIVLVIILTLFSYCLISLSKPQPDLYHGG